MHSLSAFLATDRRNALLRGESLPEEMQGAVLFADITGYTDRVREAREKLGEKLGAEKMTALINQVFEVLIHEVLQFGGVVVGFGGDAITCWFANDNGLRSLACGLAIQRVMLRYTRIEMTPMAPFQLGIKVAVAVGKAKRFVVGQADIQLLDVLAGEVMNQLAVVQKCAETGQIVLHTTVAKLLDPQIEWEECIHQVSKQAYARLKRLADSKVQIQTKAQAEGVASIDVDAKLRPWLLQTVYAWIAQGGSEFLAEIRPIIVLFLRFQGIDYANEPEAGKKLSDFVGFVQRTVTNHHGFVIKLTVDDKGSYLMCTFGAPIADDAQMEQALAAALTLQSKSLDYPFISAIQIGIAEGELLTGAFGSNDRAAYDLLGPAANLANRLMTAAQAGQILTTKEISEELAADYHFTSTEKKALKGFGEIDLYQLQGQRQSAPDSFSQPLIGRTRERRLLRQWKEDAKQNRGRTIRIEGEAGIGKSHLRAEFANECANEGFAIFQSVCSSTSEAAAYTPWFPIILSLLEIDQANSKDVEDNSTMVEKLSAAILAINPEWEIRLPVIYSAFKLETAENSTTSVFTSIQRQEVFFTLIIDLLKNRTQHQPLFIAIEDAHWIDEASLLLALAVVRAINHLPILFLLTHRFIDPQHNHQMLFAEFGDASEAAFVRVDKLSAVALRLLVQRHLGADASRLLLSLLRELAQGNPYYTLALLDDLKESKEKEIVWEPQVEQFSLSPSLIDKLQAGNCLRMDSGSGDWLVKEDAPLTALEWEIPKNFNAIVQARIDRLPPPHVLTLKTASVIGRVFESDLLSKVQEGEMPADEVNDQLDHLVVHNYIEREETSKHPSYSFSHHILQEVTYGSMLEEQKSALHRDVGRSLEKLRTSETEKLAFHFGKSSDLRKKLFYLDKAATIAQQAHANRTALNYYQQALALNVNWTRLKGLVEVLHILGQFAQARKSLEQLAKLRDTPQFELAYLWGEYFLKTSEYAQAEEWFQKARLAAQEQFDLINEAKCLNQLGWLAWRNGGRYDEAENFYKQVLNELEGWQTYEWQEAQAVIDALNSLGTLARQRGRLQEADQRYRQALALCQEYRNRALEARTLENLGSLAFDKRELEAAIPFHQASLRLSRMIGDRSGEADSQYNQSLIFRELGDLKSCQELLLTSQEIRHTLGNRWEEVNLANELGILYFELGNLDLAESALRNGIKTAERINDQEGIAYLQSNLGLVLRDLGRLVEADNVLQQGLSFMQNSSNDYQAAFFYSYLATVQFLAGDISSAEASANQALQIRQQQNLRSRTADDLATLALIHLAQSNPTAAQNCAEQIWELLEECKGVGVEFLQSARFVCFQVFEATGDERSTAALQIAYDLVQERAKKLTDTATRNSFLANVTINHEIVETWNQRATSGKKS